MLPPDDTAPPDDAAPHDDACRKQTRCRLKLPPPMTDPFVESHAMLPDPREPNPVRLPDGTAIPSVFQLSGVPQHPNIDVGRGAYASDNACPNDILQTIAPYLYPGAPERLTIGPFCQIAEGVRFITSSANHAMDGLTTYPFAIFNPDRFVTYPRESGPKPDTIIGADCWFARDVLVLPGARIGHGVIAQSGAVLRGTVPPYTIWGGNPAQLIRPRFDAQTIQTLLDLAWWDWPDRAISQAIPHLETMNIAALRALAP